MGKTKKQQKKEDAQVEERDKKAEAFARNCGLLKTFLDDGDAGKFLVVRSGLKDRVPSRTEKEQFHKMVNEYFADKTPARDCPTLEELVDAFMLKYMAYHFEAGCYSSSELEVKPKE